MPKQPLNFLRKYPLLKFLLFFHAVAITFLAALYYMQVDAVLWGSILSVPVMRKADGNWLYQRIAGGPFLMLPWNLLPQHVLWLGLDILIWGSLTICWTWRVVGNELRRQVAGREKAAAHKLREAEEASAAAARRMREAEAWEQRLEGARVAVWRLASRRRRIGNWKRRHTWKTKDAEAKKMNAALTRLKTEVSDLRRRLRA